MKGLKPSTVALPLAAALLLALAMVHACTQPRCHCNTGTDGLTRGRTMGLVDGICEQRMTPSPIGAN